MPIKRTFSSCYYGTLKNNNQLLSSIISSKKCDDLNVILHNQKSERVPSLTSTNSKYIGKSYSFKISNLNFNVEDSLKTKSIITNYHSVSSSNTVLNSFISESFRCLGTYLELPLSEEDTILYVSNTANFPEKGVLLVGDELVSYESKSFDRFSKITRGYDNSKIKSHQGGEYIRTIL